jgi:dihydroorotase-like cyclic amidohydrolase
MATLKLPGLIDMHVHLRDPGGTHKEDFASGTAAALAGGVVAVLDMPNNKPPIVDEATLRNKAELASQKARCDFALYLGATSGNARQPVASRNVAGLKVYLDETYGPLHVRDLPALMAHFRYWPRAIAVHAEGLTIAIVIGLAQAYDRPAHICHVSRKAEIELIKRAKQRGARITCEVTPHHLLLTEDDAQGRGGFAQMRPPLGGQDDREALWANLDIIDAVASDHAPHTVEEKRGKAPPPGVPGLETMLPLLMNAVAEGRLSTGRLVELTHHGPARIIGIEPPEETHVYVDPEPAYTLESRSLFTKCGWTPFEGMAVRGRVREAYLRGVKAYEEGNVLALPGFGQPLRLR